MNKLFIMLVVLFITLNMANVCRAQCAIKDGAVIVLGINENFPVKKISYGGTDYNVFISDFPMVWGIKDGDRIIMYKRTHYSGSQLAYAHTETVQLSLGGFLITDVSESHRGGWNGKERRQIVKITFIGINYETAQVSCNSIS